jgi:dihydropteroate synthase
VWCILRGIDILRVHDVKETRDAAAVAGALAGRSKGAAR